MALLSKAAFAAEGQAVEGRAAAQVGHLAR